MSLLLAYYGDDFTGSTDVMEALQWAGLRTVLFLEPPTRQQLARLSPLRAFGVAGWSRTMSPEEMDEHLRPALAALRDAGAPLVHYKICSTFDSSPQIGSIGKALEIGRELFGQQSIPILVGAPMLGRYQVFGNLFARSGLDSDLYRLDRHPTMRQHPITPMNESDLRLHLAQQTSLTVGLADILQLTQADAAERIAARLQTTAEAAMLLDVLDAGHLPVLGELLDRLASQQSSRSARPQLVIGSSGVEYALTAYWDHSQQLQELASHPPGRPAFDAVEQLLVITGSCSPVTDRQTAWALEHGFREIPLDPARLVRPETTDAEIDRVVSLAVERLRHGESVLLHSSRGPGDRRIAATITEYQRLGFSERDVQLKSGRTLGPKLGRVLQRILAAYPLRRVAVAGGDTSGYVARELAIEALEAMAPVAPGSPLCRAIATNGLDGLEIIFKGGQVGRDDIWGTVRHGSKHAAVNTPTRTR